MAAPMVPFVDSVSRLFKRDDRPNTKLLNLIAAAYSGVMALDDLHRLRVVSIDFNKDKPVLWLDREPPRNTFNHHAICASVRNGQRQVYASTRFAQCYVHWPMEDRT